MFKSDKRGVSQLRMKMIGRLKKNFVYMVSILIISVIIFFAFFCKSTFETVSSRLFVFVTSKFSWLYLISVLFFVLFVFVIAVSKYGKIKLGEDGEIPEYSTRSWFSMLFCAGTGVGLIFWGISEPISHYIYPVEQSADAADFAFKTVFIHWGIHPWSIYAVVGLTMAYFQYRKHKPALLSSILEPVIKEKNANGFVGKCIDILSVFATVAGVVTSLGLGAKQICSGLNIAFQIPDTINMQILIILIFSVVFVGSAISGIDRGVKFLSDLTLLLAMVFISASFIMGPKIEIINNFTNGLGAYIGNFIEDSLKISGFGDNSWTYNWRVFYWAWWIAWAPFVGIFIARISRGRTIREFIIGVVFVPALASLIWFSICGTLGINLAKRGVLTEAQMVEIAANPETGLFVVLRHYPVYVLMVLAVIALLCGFFVTSADSGTYVLAMLSSDGDINPSRKRRVVWGIIQAVFAIGLLMIGGLKPLQTISIVAAFPFLIVMIILCFSFYITVQKEKDING